MKVFTIILIILGVIIAYSFFDHYLSNGGLPEFLKLQANIHQNSNNEKEAKQTGINYGGSDTNYTKKTNNQTNYQEKPISNVSPYIGKVTISRVQKANRYNPSLITLNIRVNKGEEIDLTGWKIKTRKGQFSIPQGIEKYQQYMPLENIIVKEYLYVYLVGDKSPLGLNINFRVNKCLGYFSNSEDIYPSVRTSCEKIELEDVSHLSPYCQDFLIRHYGCEMPDYNEDLKISVDSQCVYYILDYFTYNGCFKRNNKDKDFFFFFWYIYLNKNIVEDLHDIIYLYDQYGRLVDEYNY